MAGNKHTRPPGGFYSILNSLSSADLELDVPRQTNQLKVHTKLPDVVFRVERLVAQCLKVIKLLIIRTVKLDCTHKNNLIMTRTRNMSIWYCGRVIPERKLVGLRKKILLVQL